MSETNQDQQNHQNGSSAAAKLAANPFPDEVISHARVQDVTMPGGAGTMALITLDNGQDHTRPTTLGPGTLGELGSAIDTISERITAGEIQAVGITGKPFVFAVGADLTGVAAVTDKETARGIAELGHEVYAKIRGLSVPTFAFVNGASLGGGLELPLQCDYRVVSAAAGIIALPECFLGLVPGWGGAWLVPNLVGIDKAVTVVLDNPLSMNRMLDPATARELGLFDAVLEPADFLVQAIRWAASVVSGETTVQRPEVDRDETRWTAVLDAAKQRVDARTGGYSPAPYAALELLAAARTCSYEEGMAAENDALARLLMGDELRAGLYAFNLTQKRAKKPVGAPAGYLAKPVTKVGIVGAGLMASQLALLFVRRLQVPVVLTDLDQEKADKAVAWVHTEMEKLAAKGRMSADGLNRRKALVSGAVGMDAFADADFVIEAVFEEMSVKKQVWAQVEKVVSETTVLATNTSSLSITEMAADLEHPERLVGFHFFNPVAVMPLLEVIRGEKTDEAALATAFATAKTLKKTAILVKDSPSFIVNRLLGRFMSEMTSIVDAGTPIEVADAGFAGIAPMAPFQLMGLVGPAIALHNNETLAEAFPDRFVVSDTLRKVVAAKKPGFYTVDEQGRQVLDPEVAAMYQTPENPVVLTAEQVREKVLSALAQEARMMLDEGVVAEPQDLDLAMITGAGFQFWNGGLTPLLDRTGIAEKVTGRRFLEHGVADVAS